MPEFKAHTANNRYAGMPAVGYSDKYDEIINFIHR